MTPFGLRLFDVMAECTARRAPFAELDRALTRAVQDFAGRDQACLPAAGAPPPRWPLVEDDDCP